MLSYEEIDDIKRVTIVLVNEIFYEMSEEYEDFINKKDKDIAREEFQENIDRARLKLIDNI